MKAREILDDARNHGIHLTFEVDITNDKPTGYKDVVYYKNELQYVHNEVKELEKTYQDMKEKNALQNLDIYHEHIYKKKDLSILVMKLHDKDISLLKSIADTLMNEIESGVIFFANVIKDESVQFIAKSNCSCSAGDCVKKASLACSGNGGGSPTFAQGGGKDISSLELVLKDIQEEIERHA